MHILTAAEEMDYFHRCAEAGYRNLADIARLILEQGLRPEEAMRLSGAAWIWSAGAFESLKARPRRRGAP